MDYVFLLFTEEVSRANWLKYGNPDGPRPYSVGIGLPSWLVRKDNHLVGKCEYTSVVFSYILF